MLSEKSESNNFESVYMIKSFLINEIPDGYFKALSYLKEIQNPDGSWGKYDAWLAPCTAIAIRVLKECGINISDEWEINNKRLEIIYGGGVKRGIGWLITNIEDNGSWGEDSWDTSQVLQTLLENKKYFDCENEIKRGVKYLEESIENNWQNEKNKEWFGPAFIAKAIDVFSLLKKEKTVKKLTKELVLMQERNGCFKGELDTKGNPKVPIVFHTAQAIRSLVDNNIKPKNISFDKCAEWIAKDQILPKENKKNLGFWGFGPDRVKTYYTSYAIIALAKIDWQKYEKNICYGIGWLYQKLDEDGAVGGDPEGTEMALLALNSYYNNKIKIELPFNVCLKIYNSPLYKQEKKEPIKSKLDKIETKQLELYFNGKKQSLDLFKLTLKERIVIHLYRFMRYSDDNRFPRKPLAITQKGMALELGVKATDINTALKGPYSPLYEEYVKESKEKSKIEESGERPKYTYYLNERGKKYAERIIKRTVQ